MIASGSTVNARRAGSTLAIATAPTSTSGAASQTHAVGEPAFGVMRASHRATRNDREHARDGAGAGQSDAFREHLTDHAPALRAEREAHADFAAALTRGVGHRAVQAEHAERERRRGGGADQHRRDALRRQRGPAEVRVECRHGDRRPERRQARLRAGGAPRPASRRSLRGIPRISVMRGTKILRHRDSRSRAPPAAARFASSAEWTTPTISVRRPSPSMTAPPTALPPKYSSAAS